MTSNTPGTAGGSISTAADYDKGPRGQQKYWTDEITAARVAVKTWHKQGVKVVKKYLAKKDEAARGGVGGDNIFNLNLFHSNTKTMMNALYGNLPTVDVSRRYMDANDDVSRVAAEMLERLLNIDIDNNGQDYDSILRSVLEDRMVPGMGCARVRYEVETEEETIIAGDPVTGEAVEVVQEKVVWEDAPIEYYHWQDVLWGWCRSYSGMRWVAYRSYMTKDEATARFGAEKAEKLTYEKQIGLDTEEGSEGENEDNPAAAWMKAAIWEIWHELDQKVIWWADRQSEVLDVKDDPLGLRGFFPSPAFFMANNTTDSYMPTPDYHFAQDLYSQIDVLSTRISIITTAVKVVGCYDQTATGIKRMMQETTDNELIPVDKWAMFGEKGGLAGQIDWMPVGEIVATLEKLQQLRSETIGLLQQVSGVSDIMRGELNNQYEANGQSQLKARHGSMNIQALQEDFTTFAQGLMQLKAEVIVKHFSPQTIVQMSNMSRSYDKDLVKQAVGLLKDATLPFRVKIRSETLAQTDFAELQQQRTSYLTALATFMQSSAPLIASEPGMGPYLLEMLQWGMAGFRGSSEIEGVLDRAIAEAKKPKPPKADPEAQKAQAEQVRNQAKMAEIQAKAQADAQIREIDKQADIETAMVTHKTKMAEIQATAQSKIGEIQAKTAASLALEEAGLSANLAQTQSTAEAEIQKDAASASIEIDKVAAQTAIKIEESAASAHINTKAKKDDTNVR